ncbi:Protein of unknown function [Mucilaginibacter lappiensis]|uniref:DUF3810 domain-containing protein n=1 Tax=Mucilaginibacter lappiensis TaxID=354630 RepID=A0ABR6PJS0_9SPHI|nr:DUF3810 domain-containing protein [Mucilaginibacter lappiensis]MBB6109881.1 hypothetical protein [Mucilaginibacter lappiensis]SIR18840.1 Protein of unknown function [Mucilaginibacter lappiensis]
MRYNLREKPLLKKIAVILLLALAIFILMQLADHPAWVERYYSEGFYIFICRVLHPVFNLFPFSVGDVIYIAIIVYLIYKTISFFKVLFQKQLKKAGMMLLGLIIGVQAGILAFYLFWGMNYFRPSAAERLNLRDTSFTTADLCAVTRLLIDSANVARARVTTADLAQSNSTIYQTAERALKSLSAGSVSFRTWHPGVKPSMLTFLLNFMGTSGYYNPFTSEAQINYQMPVFNRPFVACHEMSHQMGYGAEDEADFAGFVVAIHSNDRLLRYSGYHLAVSEFMYSLGRRDTVAYKALKATISKDVRHDYAIEHNYWLSYENKLNAISSIFYDSFLKANNQPKGLETYNRMVLLVMAQERKNWVSSLVH